jgi:tRNA A58 N-methylase Trm61
MGYKTFISAVAIARKIMEMNVKEGDIVLDCTVGNGNDTLNLAKLVGEKGKVYGFDIQPIAIEITRNKLIESGLLNRVVLINDGHERINHYIKEKLDFVIYNLGYLPRGDKTIITKASTTLESVKKALSLLKANGLLLVTSYTGHEGGKEEYNALLNFFKSLDQRMYNVLKFEFINQKNNPPTLFGVEKL